MGKRLSRGPPKLPTQQLVILAICRFAEPVAMTSVYPYLPEMIESFGIPAPDVAWWAGCTSAVFSLAQCITAIIWGRASDYFGRKPTILAGLSFTMAATLFWGLSTSLPMAITARAMAGAFNGNVGIIRTMVAEMVPEKELQPRAFSIMPLVWSLGSIFGPSFGGFFAKPAENLSGLFGNSRLLIQFPFLLPNLVASCLFLLGITTGILFLKETLETRRHKRDWGRELGSRLVAGAKLLLRWRKKHAKPFRPHGSHSEATASLLRPTSAGSDASSSPTIKETPRPAKPLPARPTLVEVFTRQSVINLIAYTFLALHSVAYDQLLPNFLHLPVESHTRDNTRLPFRFSGGFGLGSSRIGAFFTLYGISGCIIQFLIFPPVARKYGILPCLKGCALSFPPLYLLTPYTTLLPTPFLREAALCVLLLGKSFAVIFAFPCSVILLTNSAVSLRILGTLNGFSVSISAVGRAIGPAMAGGAFSWGVKRGYGITPWFLLSFVSAIGAIPVWFLVEMDGFSKSPESDDDDDDEDLLDSVDEDETDNIIHGDEQLEHDPYEEAIETVTGPSLASVPAQRRRKSSDFGGFVGAQRRTSSSGWRAMERRMSSPDGVRGGSVGPGGARKLSNGLGASMTGQGTGGTGFV